MSTHDEIETMIADIEAREDKLNDWERGFIDSVSTQFANTGSLSPKQDDTLTKIWDRVTS